MAKKTDSKDSGTATVEAPASPRLRVRYDGEIRPALRERLSIPNDLAVPRLTKISRRSPARSRG